MWMRDEGGELKLNYQKMGRNKFKTNNVLKENFRRISSI